MSGPVLTPEQTAQLAIDKAKKLSFIETLTNQISGKQTLITELGVSDSAFKKFFDYYNTDIIGKYETERKAIDGKYIASPVSESDILGTANVDGSIRTTPTMPATDVVRIPEFDGGPLVQEPTLYEQLHIADQAVVEDKLVNGYAATGTVNLTTLTTTSVTSASTTLSLNDIAAFTINTNDILVVYNGTQIAVIKAIGVIPPGMSPTINIQIIVPPFPSGTITSGANLIKFSGFNNTERTNKIAANTNLQPLMNYFIARLTLELNNRLARMETQLTALAANLDTNTTQTATIADVNASKTFINSYLITTLINNTGLTNLSNNRSTRNGQITARLTSINSLKAAHYNARYDMANNRANTSRGTLRVQKATEASLGAINDFIDGANDQIDAINSLG